LQPFYKHLNHAKVLTFLERARTQFLDDIGCPLQTLISEGIFSVVASIEVKYKRELFAGEILVTCENIEVRGKSLFVKQKIFNSRAKIAIEALVEIMFLRAATKRAGNVPEKIVKTIESEGSSGARIA
ncbi:MAG: acyl-CoA thioesterase, partial [SAR324 cluster bacterium]|nr:acyl-CoA thioesterase [SAR324 cluster bacterium]